MLTVSSATFFHFWAMMTTWSFFIQLLVKRTKLASPILSRIRSRRATPHFRALRLRKEMMKSKRREQQVYLQTHKKTQDTAFTFLKNEENTEKQQQNVYTHVHARSLCACDSCFHVHYGQSIYTRKLGVYEKYTPCSLQSDWMIQSYRSLIMHIYTGWCANQICRFSADRNIIHLSRNSWLVWLVWLNCDSFVHILIGQMGASPLSGKSKWEDCLADWLCNAVRVALP